MRQNFLRSITDLNLTKLQLRYVKFYISNHLIYKSIYISGIEYKYKKQTLKHIYCLPFMLLLRQCASFFVPRTIKSTYRALVFRAFFKQPAQQLHLTQLN